MSDTVGAKALQAAWHADLEEARGLVSTLLPSERREMRRAVEALHDLMFTLCDTCDVVASRIHEVGLLRVCSSCREPDRRGTT